MKQFFLKLFTWWNGQTFGTQLWTWRFGELVGEDEQGNRYYRTKGGKIDPTLGFERRWVVYNGYAEATRVPPSWHGWLHHTVDVAPTEESYTPHEWEKPHRPEPDGHALGLSPLRLDAGQRPPSRGHRRLPGLDARKLIPAWPRGVRCGNRSCRLDPKSREPSVAVRWGMARNEAGLRRSAPVLQKRFSPVANRSQQIIGRLIS